MGSFSAAPSGPPLGPASGDVTWDEATATIRDGTLQVRDGHQGIADLLVTADSETWLGFVAKERSLFWALLRRRIRIKGPPRLLVAFGKCFPS
jgi:putative sterol carrier protein